VIRAVLLSLTLSVLLASFTTRASAGGFYLLPRGVKGVSQGGALVAGANDPGALWYNPAGLAYSGKQLFADFVLPLERVEFTRINSGGETEPKVTMRNSPLPLPGFAASHNLGLKRFVFGLGMFAPPAALLTYPQGVRDSKTGKVGPPPQGYSALGMEGSALLFLDAGVAWRPIDGLSIGGTAGLLVGKFQARVLTFLADEGAMGQPENDEYDRPTKFGTNIIARPTGSLGMTLALDELISPRVPIRIGASYRFKVGVNGPGKFDIDLPDSGLYKDATLSSHDVNIRMDFPWIVRTGIEIRPTKKLRTELAFTHEHWSAQDAIHVQSKLRIDNVPVLQSYTVGNLDVQRKLRDTWALGFGGEYAVKKNLLVRLGGMYERGSMTKATMSVLTPDPDKVALSVGVGYELWSGIWVDAVYGHLFMRDMNVPRGTSRIYRIEALRPSLQATNNPKDIGAGYPVPLGDGRYNLEADYLGIGFRWQLDKKAVASATPASAAQAQGPAPTPQGMPAWGGDGASAK
jgi:long-chain fatty acid transport protein